MKSSLFVPLVLFDCDAKRLQEVQILCRERLIPAWLLLVRGFQRRHRLLLQLIQSDRCLQHQQNIEPLLANVLHHSGDMLRLGDAFMDSFAQLLYQVA